MKRRSLWKVIITKRARNVDDESSKELVRIFLFSFLLVLPDLLVLSKSCLEEADLLSKSCKL